MCIDDVIILIYTYNDKKQEKKGEIQLLDRAGDL